MRMIDDNGIRRPMTDAEEKNDVQLNELLSNRPHGEADRIAELEARLSRYEDNERATNILLGVSE